MQPRTKGILLIIASVINLTAWTIMTLIIWEQVPNWMMSTYVFVQFLHFLLAMYSSILKERQALERSA